MICLDRPVYLINAANDEGMASLPNDYSFPALGVLALGTWLKQQLPDTEIVVRDGGVHTQDMVHLDLYNNPPGLVGVSVLGTSYQNALDIAHTAQAFGAPVVFGNDQAAQTAGKIIKNRARVDYVIGSEYGEKSLEMLVRHEMGEPIPLESIPQLTWNQGGYPAGFDYQSGRNGLSILNSSLNQSGKREGALDVFPIVDRTLYPVDHWDRYLDNYLSKFAQYHVDPKVLTKLKEETQNEDEFKAKVIDEARKHVTGVSTMNRARGCSRANDNTKCKFCDMYLDPVTSSAEMFWKEAKAANDQVGANVLYEVCDSFSSFGKFLREVARTKPSNLGFDPKFFVYAQAADLVRDPEIVQHFKDIGVFRTNVGLESFADETLQHMKGRHDSAEKNYQALNMLKDAGIKTYGSVVLGSPPETERTLDETIDGAKRAIDEGLVADIEVQPVLPLENNEYGRMLHAAGLFPGGEEADWPVNTDEISRAFIDNFSGISYDRAIEAANEVRNYAQKAGINFGSGVSRESNYQRS